MIPIYVQSTSGETQMLTMRLKTEHGTTAEGEQITMKSADQQTNQQKINKFSVSRPRRLNKRRINRGHIGEVIVDSYVHLYVKQSH